MTVSCGLLMYLKAPLRILLVHPGGPYWRGKDLGAWSAPKGLPDPGENDLAAAIREFEEETGLKPRAPFLELSPLRQKSGKLVRCWAFEGDPSAPIKLGASRFEIEWPPGSGVQAESPWTPASQFAYAAAIAGGILIHAATAHTPTNAASSAYSMRSCPSSSRSRRARSGRTSVSFQHRLEGMRLGPVAQAQPPPTRGWPPPPGPTGQRPSYPHW